MLCMKQIVHDTSLVSSTLPHFFVILNSCSTNNVSVYSILFRGTDQEFFEKQCKPADHIWVCPIFCLAVEFYISFESLFYLFGCKEICFSCYYISIFLAACFAYKMV